MKIASRELTEKVIGCAIDVHKELGPGLLESAYELALVHDMGTSALSVERQRQVELAYKGVSLGTGFRADLVVEDVLLVELKTVELISKLHIAQVITYLKLMDFKRGLLLNFNATVLRDGIKRVSI